MSIGFFIVGAIIFSIYLYFTIWNIYYSNNKQREESYPTVREKQIPKKVELENGVENGLENEVKNGLEKKV
jgi:hypothetical protein